LIRNTLSEAIDEDGNKLEIMQMINVDGALANGQMRFDYENPDVFEHYVAGSRCEKCGEELVCRREVVRTNDRYFADGIIWKLPIVRETKFLHSCHCGQRQGVRFQSWDEHHDFSKFSGGEPQPDRRDECPLCQLDRAIQQNALKPEEKPTAEDARVIETFAWTRCEHKISCRRGVFSVQEELNLQEGKDTLLMPVYYHTFTHVCSVNCDKGARGQRVVGWGPGSELVSCPLCREAQTAADGD